MLSISEETCNLFMENLKKSNLSTEESIYTFNKVFNEAGITFDLFCKGVEYNEIK